MSIIQSVPWRVQPQIEVGVDWGNSVTRGMGVLITPTAPRNLVSGRFGTLGATTVLGAGGAGRFYGGTNSGSEGMRLTDSAIPSASTVELTILTVMERTAATGAGNNGFIGVGDSWIGDYQASYLRLAQTTEKVQLVNYATAIVESAAIPLGQIVALAAAQDASSSAMWVDGTLAATGSAGTGQTFDNQFTWLNLPGALSGRGQPIKGYLAAIWFRKLSPGELASVTARPWQLFAPLPRRIWAPAAGGGTSIAGALGTASASGFKGNVNANRTLGGALGTATASGFKGVVNANRTIAGALGVAAASGFAGNVGANRGIAGALGTAVASGLSGTVSNTNDTVIGGTLGIAIASGLIGAVNASTVISGNLGTAVASGLTGTVSNGTTTDLALILKILSNRQELNATTGKFTLYDDDGVTVLYQSDAWEDTAGTIPYRGKALRRIDALA